MSNKSHKPKTKITKISAKPPETAEKPAKNHKTPKITVPSVPKSASKPNKKSRKNGAEKPLKEIFILARPFVAFGRYLRDSWRELRQVRWPNRKATWKMTVAVLIYCAIFIVFIVLLDTFFNFIFNLLLTK